MPTDAADAVVVELTAAETRWLGRANARGLIDPLIVNGLEKATFHRAMARLVAKGVVVPYVHGGYELTALGATLATAVLAEKDGSLAR